jgi:uracil phosphoribosyltransferase
MNHRAARAQRFLLRAPPTTVVERGGADGPAVGPHGSPSCGNVLGRMSGNVHVIEHPLVQHKLSLMRSKETSTSTFRNLLREISMLLAYEVCRDMLTTKVAIETPIAPMMAPVLDGKKIVIVSIMRAGSGILDGMLEILPSARVGHIGLYRDPKTLVAVEYYYKVPDNMGDRDTIVVDPMLATGNSAVAAIERLKASGPKSIKFVCLLTCPEGIKEFHAHHPDVPVYTAAVDERLNDKSYIVPGLGDAGDRLYGTK